MKLCRFETLEFAAQHPGRTPREVHVESRAGILEDGLIREITGELWGDRRPAGRQWRVDEVRFLPPCWPSKIICVGKNYPAHNKEMDSEAPKEPLIFSKPPSSIIAPEDPIVLPRNSQRVDHEAELAVIISRRFARPRANEDLRPYIAGYTCLNDVTARDLQRLDVQYTRAKGFDTFCPFGPVLETEAPPPGTTVEGYVNGEKRQSGRLAEMIFSVDVVLRAIAETMTLEPGDLIATGTPSGVGPLHPGDVVEVRISGIGTLRNPVVGPRD